MAAWRFSPSPIGSICRLRIWSGKAEPEQMIGLDLGNFSPEMAKLVLLRGAGLPGLSWIGEGHRVGRKRLEAAEDRELFGCESLADEKMGAAVRALLYLWLGWPGDCAMFAQVAGDAERAYITGLCERHARHFDKAKELFKQLGGHHAIYQDLTAYALTASATAADPCVRRLREMLEQDQRWEAFLFCDALAQASAGKIKPAGEAVLRQIQCREFELLLAYCHEKAVGGKQKARLLPDDAERRAAERERQLREIRRRRVEKHKRDKFRAEMNTKDALPPQPTASTGASPSRAAPVKIGVLCPKCGYSHQMNADQRGKLHRCEKCATAFLVPPAGSPGGALAAPAADGVVAVLCPKCSKRLVLPAALRGKLTSCLQCQTTFMVPKPPVAVTAR